MLNAQIVLPIGLASLLEVPRGTITSSLVHALALCAAVPALYKSTLIQKNPAVAGFFVGSEPVCFAFVHSNDVENKYESHYLQKIWITGGFRDL